MGIVLLNIPVILYCCPLITKLSVICPNTTHMRGNATPWAAEHIRPISISSTSRQVAYRNCNPTNMLVKHMTSTLRVYHRMLHHSLQKLHMRCRRDAHSYQLKKSNCFHRLVLLFGLFFLFSV